MSDSKKHPAVGIDLGTTFSAVAYLDNSGRPETIRSAEGDMTTPSAVFFDRKSPIVGMEAVEAGLLEPERLALYAKRDVGEDTYEKQIRGETFPPEVIQALVLRKLKEDAELKLGEITKAVVTVPAFFNEPCRKATQDAGRLAGLEVLDIINEPTAAAITYGVQQGFLSEQGESEKLERVLVYDLGGGTFDVTVMEIDKGNYHTIATAGDVYLGGVDWDQRIVDFISEEFIKEHGVDPREDPRGEQELIRKANQTKHALTQRESVSIAFAFEGQRLRTELTQTEFAKLTEDLVERTLMTVQLVLDDSALAWSDLTRLILVGGSTRMPMIRDELTKRSGFELDRSLSPDEAVSHGAALYAGMLLGHAGEHARVSVTNVNSHDLGILAVDPKTGNPRRQVMIPRNSSLPCKKEMRFRTHQDNQANVKIEVIEGGDDRGMNATKIGKCIVDDLPPKTPKGTAVDVNFDYAQDGRLTISASLPEVERNVQMTLDRAAGLTDDEIQTWRERIKEGLRDPDPDETAPESEPVGIIDDDPDELLPDDEDIPFAIVTDEPAAPTPKSPAPKPIVVVGDSNPNTPKKITPKKVIAKKVTPSDGPKKLTPKPVVKAKPKPVVKAKPVAGAKPVVKPKPASDSVPEIKIGPPGGADGTKKTPVKKLVKTPASRVSPLAVNKDEGDAPAMPKLGVPPGLAPQAAQPQAGDDDEIFEATIATPAAAPKPGKPKLVKAKKVAPESTSAPAIGPPKKPKPAKPAKAKKAASGPKLDLGDVPDTPKVSANPGDPDFSQLMGLGGGAPKKKVDAPVIVTSDAPPAGKKKKGGWKSRSKKLSSDQDED